MPGEMQIVEGKIQMQTAGDMHDATEVYYDVDGLQEILEKWVGRKVSITIEDVTE